MQAHVYAQCSLERKTGTEEKLQEKLLYVFKSGVIIKKRSVRCTENVFVYIRVSNLRPGAPNWPAEDYNLAHWTALENVKKGMNFGLLTVFS